MSEANRRAEILTGGAKALLIINGGGVIALLGILGKLLPFEGNDEKYYASLILFGIGFLSAGLVISTANYYFRFWSSAHWVDDKDRFEKFNTLERWSVALSFFCFIIGVFSIIIRMYVYINP